MIRNVAIMGATGAVGQELLKILEQRNFPLQNLKLLASERSVGREYEFKGEKLKVELTCKDAFKNVDLVLSSAGASVSKEFAPIAVDAGAVVVDNTSFFRMDPNVPLVVPEVNPEDIKLHKGIIANPNCTTIMMVVALKPINDLSKIKTIHVSSYQSASGAGATGMAELKQQYQEIVEGKPVTVKKFAHQLAYNLIPHIDVFTDNGYTKEEMKRSCIATFAAQQPASAFLHSAATPKPSASKRNAHSLLKKSATPSRTAKASSSVTIRQTTSTRCRSTSWALTTSTSAVSARTSLATMA